MQGDETLSSMNQVSPSIEMLSTYLEPLQTIIQQATSQHITNTEFKDLINLIISFEEAKWITNYLFQSFFDHI